MKLSEFDPASGIPRPAPIEYAGQWVAWNTSRTEIVAHGLEFSEVRAAAMAAGQPDAIFQHVRKPGVSYIGYLSAV